MDWVVWAIVLLLVVLFAALLALSMWLNVRYERAIRIWADQNGYGIIRLEYRRVFPSSGRRMLLGAWFIEVEDEEGGLQTGWVSFGSWLIDLPWGKIDVTWQ